MARAKTQKVETTVDAPTTNAVVEDFNTNGHAADYRLIPIRMLETSPTNPRKRFPESSILELAGSIREKGILEPLIVRELDKRKNGDEAFEIVCGERRYRASWDVGDFKIVDELPCMVRTLTDEEVLDIQIHENLHREDVHPMDEAYGYKFLQEKLACTVEELSLRVGKSESYVLNRLKLNSLIPEAQKDLEDGFLPITHALEIAKFGEESQKSILESAAYKTEQKHEKGAWVYVPIKTEPLPFSRVKEWVEENILFQLSKTPFDKKSEALRADGMSCVKCPERTGENAVLFDVEMTGKKDRCLNPSCWNAKSEKHVWLLRDKLAHEASVEPTEIPFVDTQSYNDRQTGEITVYGYDSFKRIDPKSKEWRDSDKTCDKQVRAVNIAKEGFGKVVDLCMDHSCQVHFKSNTVRSSKPATGKAAEAARERELDEKRQRKEELFDVAVGERTRKRVFRLAADKFAEKFIVTGAGNNFLPLLLAKLWVTSNNGADGTTKNTVVRAIMSEVMDSDVVEFSGYEQRGKVEGMSKLSPANQARMLFLFTHGNSGAMYGGNYTSQKDVIALAEEYGIDHQLIDAEERLAQASKKAKPEFEIYLKAIQDGKRDAEVPRQFTNTYKPKE